MNINTNFSPDVGILLGCGDEPSYLLQPIVGMFQGTDVVFYNEIIFSPDMG